MVVFSTLFTYTFISLVYLRKIIKIDKFYANLTGPTDVRRVAQESPAAVRSPSGAAYAARLAVDISR